MALVGETRHYWWRAIRVPGSATWRTAAVLARAGRYPRSCDRGGPDLPRGADGVAGRLSGRRGLLRPERLLDHGTPGRRVATLGPRRPGQILVSARAAPAPRPVLRDPGDGGLHREVAAGSTREPARRPAARNGLCRELAPGFRATTVFRDDRTATAPAAPVVARRRRAVLCRVAARPHDRTTLRLSRVAGRGTRVCGVGVRALDGLPDAGGCRRSAARLLRDRHACQRSAPRRRARARATSRSRHTCAAQSAAAPRDGVHWSAGDRRGVSDRDVDTAVSRRLCRSGRRHGVPHPGDGSSTSWMASARARLAAASLARGAFLQRVLVALAGAGPDRGAPAPGGMAGGHHGVVCNWSSCRDVVPLDRAPAARRRA